MPFSPVLAGGPHHWNNAGRLAIAAAVVSAASMSRSRSLLRLRPPAEMGIVGAHVHVTTDGGQSPPYVSSRNPHATVFHSRIPDPTSLTLPRRESFAVFGCPT
jgi:hypothetical protein